MLDSLVDDSRDASIGFRGLQPERAGIRQRVRRDVRAAEQGVANERAGDVDMALPQERRRDIEQARFIAFDEGGGRESRAQVPDDRVPDLDPAGGSADEPTGSTP